MGLWEIALSALVGGLIATLISIWYQHVSDKIKDRKYIIIAVTDWIDNIYTRLQVLSAHKECLLIQGQESMTSQEYRAIKNEMRILLLSNKIIIEVACEYGEGSIMQQINTLRENMLTAARIFWTARQETWADSHAQIMNLFNNEIDPLREKIMVNLFDSLKGFTIYNLLIRRLKSFFICKDEGQNR